MTDIFAKPRKPAPDWLGRAVIFEAWVGNRPVFISEGGNWEDALYAALSNAKPKDFVSVLMHDAGQSRQIVRFYRVKQSTKKGFWRDSTSGGRKVFVGELIAHLEHEMEVDAFEPKRPFDAFRDDPTGHDSNLIEVKP